MHWTDFLTLIGCLTYFFTAALLLWWLFRSWPPPEKSGWRRMWIPLRGTLIKRRRVFHRRSNPDPEGKVAALFECARGSHKIRLRIGRRFFGERESMMEAWDIGVVAAQMRLVKVIPPGTAIGWVQTRMPRDSSLILGVESILLRLPLFIQLSAAGHELAHCAQEIRSQSLIRCWSLPPRKAGPGEGLMCELEAHFWFPLIPVTWLTVLALATGPILIRLFL